MGLSRVVVLSLILVLFYGLCFNCRVVSGDGSSPQEFIKTQCKQSAGSNSDQCIKDLSPFAGDIKNSEKRLALRAVVVSQKTTKLIISDVKKYASNNNKNPDTKTVGDLCTKKLAQSVQLLGQAKDKVQNVEEGEGGGGKDANSVKGFLQDAIKAQKYCLQSLHGDWGGLDKKLDSAVDGTQNSLGLVNAFFQSNKGSDSKGKGGNDDDDDSSSSKNKGKSKDKDDDDSSSSTNKGKGKDDSSSSKNKDKGKDKDDDDSSSSKTNGKGKDKDDDDDSSSSKNKGKGKDDDDDAPSPPKDKGNAPSPPKDKGNASSPSKDKDKGKGDGGVQSKPKQKGNDAPTPSKDSKGSGDVPSKPKPKGNDDDDDDAPSPPKDKSKPSSKDVPSKSKQESNSDAASMPINTSPNAAASSQGKTSSSTSTTDDPNASPSDFIVSKCQQFAGPDSALCIQDLKQYASGIKKDIGLLSLRSLALTQDKAQAVVNSMSKVSQDPNTKSVCSTKFADVVEKLGWTVDNCEAINNGVSAESRIQSVQGWLEDAVSAEKACYDASSGMDSNVRNMIQEAIRGTSMTLQLVKAFFQSKCPNGQNNPVP